MATCTGHLTAGEAIKLIVNRMMGIHNNQRRHNTLCLTVSDRGPRNSTLKGIEVHLSLDVVLSTMKVAIRLVSVPPQFCGRTPWGLSRATFS
ncbi:hypothetical protein TNCV_635911 [Trichonephila clavipes]|nr:hypothetical protein TNCV_635911 [Trichonephila clavipes]